MSHSTGEIWSLDGQLLGHFEYNGTVDMCCTRVHLTKEAMLDCWRKDNWRDCSCGAIGQTVLLYTTYGGGVNWEGKVCWNCMAIVGGVDSSESVDGHPFLEPTKE